MTVKLEDHMTWPRVNSVWSHRNGNVYQVLDYTNVESDRQDDYPTTVVYRNLDDGRKYSRRLVDWDRSMSWVRD